ncbi:MAG: hypothetical protein ACRD3E_00070 [Terriglobales bacterium]
MSSGPTSTGRADTRARDWPLVAVALPLIGVALWRIAVFAAHVPIAAAFQHDYEEGNILNALLRITRGSTPYPDPHVLPSILNPYGPAAYYLLAVPAKLFGVTFFFPRLMIICCTVAVAAVVAIEARRLNRSWILGVAFGFVFLAIPNIQQWMWLLRVDLLGLAFTAAGLIVFSRELENHPESPRTFIPALLFAIAILVKPTLLAAPAACFTALVLRRDFRTAARLTLQTAAVFGGVLGAVAVATRGAVLTDIFLTHPDPFSFHVFTQGLTAMIVASWPLVLLAGVALARDVGARRFSPAVLWIVFATATALTAGKLGSNSNHFVEWNAALCIAAAAGLDEIRRAFRSSAAPAAALALIAIVLAIQPAFATEPVNRDCAHAYESVRRESGDIISENVGALVLGGNKVWVSNPYVLAQLVEHSGWSDAALVEMVRERRFAAIYTHYDYVGIPAYLAHGTERASPELLRAMAANYAASPGFDCSDLAVVYRPKAPAAIQSTQVR